MRRVLLALLTAAALAVSGLTLPAAWGATVEAVDAGVSINELVDEIAPAGSYGLYDVTVSFDGLDEAGLSSADVTLTNTVTGGTIDPDYSDEDCAMTCTVSFEADGNQTFRVAVVGQTNPVTLTSSVTLDDVTDPNDGTLIGVDNNPDNDSDTEETPVNDLDDGADSQAFVPEGGSLTFKANGQTHVLTVTEAHGSGGGAIVNLSDPDHMDCNNDGTPDCHGVRVEFEQGEDGEEFDADTELDSSREDKPPCQGLGDPSGCVDIFGRQKPEEPMEKLQSCDSDPTTRDHRCVRDVFKVDGNIHWLVALKTIDPDIGLPDIPIDL